MERKTDSVPLTFTSFPSVKEEISRAVLSVVVMWVSVS